MSDVAPYSGLVAVTVNSRTLPDAHTSADPAYATVQRRCELIAEHCGCFALIRIDARRRSGSTGDFIIFDVNMKPVSRLGARSCTEEEAKQSRMLPVLDVRGVNSRLR